MTDFSGSDIRGCDFSGAILSGANFAYVKAGLSLRQRIFLTLWVAIVGGLVGDAMSRLVFNTVGQSPLDSSAAYLPFLYVILSLTTLSSAFVAIAKHTKLEKPATIATAMLCGAVIGFGSGFFHPGAIQAGLEGFYNQEIPSALTPIDQFLTFLRAQKVKVALLGAIVAATLLFFLGRFRHKTSFKIAISVASCIVSYAATFLCGTIASAFLTTQKFLFGIPLSLLTVMFLVCTTLSFLQAVYEWNHAIGTSFRGAELTHTNFNYADLRNTDFSKAIGDLPREVK